ncbi:hypothetical protein EI94DRAFT_1700099 [Lactarius quietus]|nr:hypothetical protein EI94DRAFT_1700099 [Lactarius quietus]
MAPHTRQAQQALRNTQIVVIDNNVILEHPTKQPVVSGIGNRYCDLSQAQPNLTRLAHGHPMKLKIIDAEPRQPSSGKANGADGVTGSKGKQRNLQQTASFYPGYSGAASILDPNAQHFLDSTFKDQPVEDEEDWINDNQELTPLAQGLTTRMAEARVFKRPSWELDTIGTICVTMCLASSQHSNVSAATLQLAAESIVALAPSALDAEEEQITKVATT